MLMVARSLVKDEITKARINRELATRRHPMPEWLRGLDDAQAEPTVLAHTHVLGDGDDFLFGVTLPVHLPRSDNGAPGHGIGRIRSVTPVFGSASQTPVRGPGAGTAICEMAW